MHQDAGHGPAELSDSRFAMRLSLAFGVLMLAGKGGAWWITGSAAILSDAMESVIHVVAVAFAAYSMGLSQRPANDRFRYGYERIGFFSAGFEGALIGLAAVSIIYVAIEKWRRGLVIDELGKGTLIVLAASLINLALGLYLVHTGRKNRSIILEANGKHVLTDSWTSFGVVAGLGMVLLTGWKPFDPICAILVALNILWSGWGLISRSVRGLMDYSDPKAGETMTIRLLELTTQYGIDYHGLRWRDTGGRCMVEVHLLFPYDMPVGRAHQIATEIEDAIENALPLPSEVVTHLESVEDHGPVHHQVQHGPK